MDLIQQDLLSYEEVNKLFFESKSMKELPPLKHTSMGPEDADVGILAQHGFIGSNLDLMYISSFLAREGYRVILPILPGHGRSYQDMHGIPFNDWIEHVGNSIEYLKNEKPGRKIFLMGHSLGGGLSLIHSTRRDDIEGIIAMSTPIGYGWFVHGIAKVLGSVIGNFKMAYKDFIFYDERLYDNPYIQHLDKNFGKVTISTLKQVIYLIEEIRKALPNVYAPSLVIHSKYDKTVPVRSAKKIMETIQSENKKYVELDKSYHIVVADTDRDVVVEEILEFIKEVLSS